jgi:hypothetical protein
MSNPQIGVEFSNIPKKNVWPFSTFSNRRPMTSHPLGHGFETMMEKGQDQIQSTWYILL